MAHVIFRSESRANIAWTWSHHLIDSQCQQSAQDRRVLLTSLREEQDEFSRTLDAWRGATEAADTETVTGRRLLTQLAELYLAADRRELEATRRALQLRMENEKLKALLDAKTTTLIKMKKNLEKLKTVVDVAFKGVLECPQRETCCKSGECLDCEHPCESFSGELDCTDCTDKHVENPGIWKEIARGKKYHRQRSSSNKNILDESSTTDSSPKYTWRKNKLE